MNAQTSRMQAEPPYEERHAALMTELETTSARRGDSKTGEEWQAAEADIAEARQALCDLAVIYAEDIETAE